MKRIPASLLGLLVLTGCWAQDILQYTLRYSPEDAFVSVEIEFDAMNASTIKLVIPRSAPGTYDLTNYLAFVDQVTGSTMDGEDVPGTVGDGSFFAFEASDEMIHKVRYRVDLQKMEQQLLGGFASSKIRDNYVGILGYSVFGFLEGANNRAIQLTIECAPDWPIFTTLSPSLNRSYGSIEQQVENFDLLADAQYILGDAVQLYKIPDVDIPFFVAAYAETEIDITEIGRRGKLALNGLAEYFGYVPMPHYTMFYEFLQPVSTLHDYGFSMEHLNSMSASFDTSRAITRYRARARIGSMVHHIAHSWIPLRSYGVGYRPFEWQTAPLIETIWLNEGFIWYISFYNVLNNPEIINRFKTIVVEAPEYIASKSLSELSFLGSTQYSMDFRIGKNLFARGALMAHEMDKLIQQGTEGQKTFKNAMLGLLKWTEQNQRAFEYHEIEPILSSSSGVDLSEIWVRWQKAPKAK